MDHRSELVDVIRRVRNRWRLKLALRGAVIVVAGTVLALLLSASGLETFRFSAPAIIAFRDHRRRRLRGLLFYGLVWPLRRRVTDAQVAMYLEERNPTLEAGDPQRRRGAAGGGSDAHSPRLVEKLVEQAIEQCRAIDHTHAAIERHARAGVMRRRSRRLPPRSPCSSRSVRPICATACRRCSHLRSAEASSPYKIEVTAGQHQGAARRRSDGEREADGFASNDVTVMMRPTPNAAFERVPLMPGTEPAASKACCSTSRSRPSMRRIERRPLREIHARQWSICRP